MAKVLRAVRPNLGVQRAYERRLERLVEEMRRSVTWWLVAAWRRNAGRITTDALPGARGEHLEPTAKNPVDRLGWLLRRLSRYWFRRWNREADRIADWFVHSSERHTLASHAAAFRAAGLTVTVSPAGRLADDTVRALIAENVALIRSLPRHCFDEITSMVQRSVSMGRDVPFLEGELKKRFAVTENRARTIARDQSVKACEAITREQNRRLGITEGIWIHVPGRKYSRKSHQDMNGKRFSLSEGLYDRTAGKKVLPGELVNCFPEGSKLHGIPFAEKLYRRWYAGKLAQIVTDDGGILAVTPNHPVLTTRGWTAAGLLNVGDYIVKTAQDSLLLTELDANGVVPTFDELFNALVLLGVAPTVFDGSTSDFHGDGTDGKIDIIDVNSLLSNIDNAELIKSLCDLGFSVPEVGFISALLSGNGSRKGLFASDTSFHGFMRRCRERLPIFFGRISVAEFVSLALAAQGNPGMHKDGANDGTATSKFFGNSLFAYASLVHGYDFLFREGILERFFTRFGDFDTSLPNVTAQRIGADVELLRKRFQQDASTYRIARVVDNCAVDFTGHVYNLQTALGWYIAEKTVSCNCRCTYRAVVPDFGEVN